MNMTLNEYLDMGTRLAPQVFCLKAQKDGSFHKDQNAFTIEQMDAPWARQYFGDCELILAKPGMREYEGGAYPQMELYVSVPIPEEMKRGR